MPALTVPHRDKDFYSFGEICNCALGRGGAVGAGRKLPAHSRVLSQPRARPSTGSPAGLCRDAACCVAIKRPHALQSAATTHPYPTYPLPPIHDWFPLFLCPTLPVPTPYLRRTIAVPPLVHPRISPRNPNMKRRRYGDGTAMVRRWCRDGVGAYHSASVSPPASVPGGISRVCSDVACRVAILSDRLNPF